MLCPIASLLTDPSKLAIALFIAEFLYHALKDEQTNTPLFDYIRSSIEWLDNRQDHYANFHLVFLIHLSRFLGFFPNLSKEERSKEGSNEIRGEGVYFDLRAATFCTTPPPHHDYLMPEEAGHIALIMRMDYATMHLFRLTRAERNRILEIVEHYYRLHLPAFPELRSLPVLRELFD
jgi:DNA repair protein RecO (recombination protein O)